MSNTSESRAVPEHFDEMLDKHFECQSSLSIGIRSASAVRH